MGMSVFRPLRRRTRRGDVGIAPYGQDRRISHGLKGSDSFHAGIAPYGQDRQDFVVQTAVSRAYFQKLLAFVTACSQIFGILSNKKVFFAVFVPCLLAKRAGKRYCGEGTEPCSAISPPI